MKRLGSILLLMAATFAPARPVDAHPMAPALYDLRISESGEGTLTWKTPPVRPGGSALQPIIPEACTRRGQPTWKLIDSGAASLETQSVTCDLSKLEGLELGVRGIESTKETVVVRYSAPDGLLARGLLARDKPTFRVPKKQGRIDVVTAYIELGFEHLISGFDHIVFVLGLLVLIGWNRKLLWAITAFTLGHSLTLGLAVFGVINLPSRLIEIAIAVTIMIVALEIKFSATSSASATSAMMRRPGFWPACFGLLHGMGFASALAETGVPEGEVPLALFSFNVGIEIGQLAVVSAAAMTVALVRTVAPGFQALPRTVSAYAIGALAAYWIIERVLTG